MASIKIQNLGPIKDSGMLTLTEVMLIIGRQSSGKSTFMKVLCFCRWIEKRVMTGDPVQSFCQTFVSKLKHFYRLDDLYFQEDTRIEYEGDVVSIRFLGNSKKAEINVKNCDAIARYNTKIGYIPSERNLVSAVRNINATYKSSDRDMLFNFILEWNEYKRDFTRDEQLKLSLTENFTYYDEDNQDYVVLPNRKPITSFFASSGVQSIIPIDVISEKATDAVGKIKKYSVDDLNRMLDLLNNGETTVFSDKVEAMREHMKYKSAQLFIEEPEQNLYPDAQRLLALNLVRRIKKARQAGDKQSLLVITTHSPYLLTSLNVLMAESAAKQLNPADQRINDIVDDSTLLPVDSYSAYFISKEGEFMNIKDTEIPMFSGIELDSVSDWVDEHISRINELLYSE